MPLVNGRSQAAERTRLARPHTEGSERRRGLPGTPAPYLFGRGRRYTPPPPAQPPHVATAQAARLGRQRGRSATTSPAIGPSATTSSSAGRPALQVQPELGSDTLSGAARKSSPAHQPSCRRPEHARPRLDPLLHPVDGNAALDRPVPTADRLPARPWATLQRVGLDPLKGCDILMG